MNAPAASLRRPLVEPRDLKALSARSDSTGLRHLAGHLTAIGCAMALVLAARHGSRNDIPNALGSVVASGWAEIALQLARNVLKAAR